MMSQEPKRSTWLMVTASLTVAPIIYGFVGLQVAGAADPSPILPTLRLVAFPVAAVLLLVGAIVIRRAPRAGVSDAATGPAGALAAPAQFNLMFLIGCGMFESSAVIGFLMIFLGGSLRDYVPLGAATLAAMLAVALPTGLRYWSERERLDSGGSAPLS